MKNNEKLLDIIGEVDEQLVPDIPPKKDKIKWVFVGSLCAVLAIAIALTQISGRLNRAVPIADSTVASTETTTQAPVYAAANVEPLALAQAVYPEMPAYPGEGNRDGYEEWSEALRSLRNQPQGYNEGYKAFFKNTAAAFLTADDNQNAVYSPMSLYMVLAMCAETTDSGTRQQLLEVLAAQDIDTLRRDAKGVWQTSYVDDGMAKCVLANSLWMNYQIPYNQAVLDTLASEYYASAFSGDPASREYNELLQSWLSEQTDDLLADAVQNIHMEPETVLALASTVNYCGKWQYQFDKERTTTDTFHAPGGDISCRFMHIKPMLQYAAGTHFSAVALPLENNGFLCFLLPEEGYTPQSLLTEEEALSYMQSPTEYKNSEYPQVNLSLPQFDVAADIDLTDGLRTLGITDIFNRETADFSPLTDHTIPTYVTQVRQSNRVMIDEEGCRAASLTVMMRAGADPSGEVDFTLDRPFLFVLTGNGMTPIMAGIVNMPQ